METNLDIASENEQIMRDNAVKDVRERLKAGPELKPTGRCHNPICDDDLENKKGVFCPGGQCAAEYEQGKKTNGRARTLKV